MPGFTLVEILMAIAISTLILGAAAMFLYSSFMLLEQAQNDPGLDHHKLTVANFISSAFQTARPDTEIPQNPNQTNATATDTTGNTTGNTTNGLNLGSSLGHSTGSNTQSRAGTQMAQTLNAIGASSSLSGGSSLAGGNSTGNTTGNTTGNATADSGVDMASLNEPKAVEKSTLVGWGWPPGTSTASDPMLSFVLPSDNPLLVWDSGPRPPVRCFLYFKEREGLSLLWVPPYSPREYEANAVRRTMLSALVVKMSYLYYNQSSHTWDIDDAPKRDTLTSSFVIPDYVRLTFDLGGKLSNMTIAVPPAQSSVPIY